MKTLIQLRSFIVPASIVLVLVAVVGFYNLFVLPAEQKYLDDRNFRLLTTLSDQIGASINNFDGMLDNAADSQVTADGLESYLKIVAPQVESLDSESRDQNLNDYGDPPKIRVQADEGTHFVYLYFKRKKAGTDAQYAIRMDLAKLVRKILPPDNRNPFDVVLVAQGDGTVIFQKSASGIAVARINSLEDTKKAPKTSKSDGEAKSISEFEKFSFSSYREINLAGDRFRLYSQPLPISLPPADVLKDGTLHEQWVLCGLVRVATFQSESQSISNTYLLWILVAVLLVVAAYPFLKLRISSPAERLRPIDVVMTAIMTCVAVTTLTFALLDVYYSRMDFGKKESAEPMQAIAKAIDENFNAERGAALQQLSDFYKDEKLREALDEERKSRLEHPIFTQDRGGCAPLSACRDSILKKDKVTERAWSYPYLEFAAWSDSNGQQQIKWATRKHVTPFIKMDKSTVSYYPDIEKAFAFRGSNEAESVPHDGVGAQYSPNTGDYITIFWKVSDGEGGTPRDEKDAPGRPDMKEVLCGSIITRPISVVNPIMPAEFQFAIIRRDGMVVYHSDPTRNSREDFFAETDQNQEVKSRVSTGAEGEFVAKYMGRGHRLYIRPMTHIGTNPWTVIVFRDLRLEETMNMEVVSLASILFVIYALMMAIVLLVLHRTGRSYMTGRWLWPDSRNAGIYMLLAAVNTGVVVLLLLLPMLRGVLALLLCAIGIPIGVLIFSVLKLRRRDEKTSSEEQPAQEPPGWKLSYFTALSTLLMVVAAAPCITFFKVAWDFEQRLLIERSQLRLAADLDDRKERVRGHYVNFDLGPKVREELLAGPEERPNQYFSYHGSFLNTKIDSASSVEEVATQEGGECGFGSPCYQQELVASFLNQISPLYNEIVYEERFMEEAAQNPLIWSSGSLLGDEEIKLTSTSHSAGNRSRIIRSTWAPLRVPWGDWKCWLGALACVAALFWLVSFSLKRIFLLGLRAPDGGQDEHSQPAAPDPKDLLADLSINMVIIGRKSSPVVARLVGRKDVQAHDLYQWLTATAMKIPGRSNGSTSRDKAAHIADEIKANGRTVLFYNFERGVGEPAVYQEMLSVLERVLSNPERRVVIVSAVDPCSKVTADEREEWQRLVHEFVRIDLNAGPTKGSVETNEAFEARISEDGYYNWLFSSRSETQRLVLVQLAEEGLVNPNSRHDIRELMNEKLVARKNGILSIQDKGFSQFLRKNASCDVIKEMESHVPGRANTLRTSLLVAGVAGMGFLLYTQGSLVNTWITYATGLAASIPALMKVFELMRGGSAAKAA